MLYGGTRRSHENLAEAFPVRRAVASAPAVRRRIVEHRCDPSGHSPHGVGLLVPMWPEATQDGLYVDMIDANGVQRLRVFLQRSSPLLRVSSGAPLALVVGEVCSRGRQEGL